VLYFQPDARYEPFLNFQKEPRELLKAERSNLDLIQSANLSQATKKDKWIGYWGKHWTLERFDKIKPWQKVNHFPMSFEVGRKDKMYAYKRMKTKVGPEYKNELDFVPKTFLLPNEFKSLKLAFHEFYKIKQC
jgi:hypothetical protein